MSWHNHDHPCNYLSPGECPSCGKVYETYRDPGEPPKLPHRCRPEDKRKLQVFGPPRWKGETLRNYTRLRLWRGVPLRCINLGVACSTFWEYVAVGDPNGCWEWLGPKVGGRAVMRYTHHQGSRAAVSAHRLAYQLTYGPVTDEQRVRRTCSNPLCCNPAHMTAGPQPPQRKGGKRGRPRKLNREQARIIKRVLAFGTVTQRELAEMFGVTAPTISNIARGYTWAEEEI